MFRHQRGKEIIFLKKSRNPTHNTIGNSSSSNEPIQEEKEETESAMTQEGGMMEAVVELYQ